MQQDTLGPWSEPVQAESAKFSPAPVRPQLARANSEGWLEGGVQSATSDRDGLGRVSRRTQARLAREQPSNISETARMRGAATTDALPSTGHLTFAREAISAWIRQEWSPGQEPHRSSGANHSAESRTGSALNAAEPQISHNQEVELLEQATNSHSHGEAALASPARHPSDGPHLLVASGAPKLWSRIHQPEPLQQVHTTSTLHSRSIGEGSLSILRFAMLKSST